ncbi:MAG: cation diffusion facilitator family transporter [Rickettsiales bacterium]|jgi:cobalt-zinc-cadmium efflux system protein|nr:cation diffusion facilitator family transporter [Rickettsiales bacterium]
MKNHENLKDHRDEGGHSGHRHHVSGDNEGAALISLLITFSFMIIEFIGGYISGSLALTTDAVHMLVDAGVLLSTWAGFYFGRIPTNSRKTFGYQRFEILASLFNALLLFCLTLFVSLEALKRLSRPVEIMSGPMLVISVLGLLVNCAVFYILNRGEKSHLNIKGAILHVIGDLLGSVAAILASIVIYITGWTPIDSILSIFACLLVLNSAARLLLDSLNVLMEGAPPSFDIAEMEQHVRKIPNVRNVCHVHVWEITSGKVVIMLDIELENQAQATETVRIVKTELIDDFGVHHANVGIASNPL